jgi:predicted transcriptional regulator
MVTELGSDGGSVTNERLYTDIEFLAGSLDRFRILVALEQSPRSRGELQEVVGSHRTTLRRTLRALAKRGWIEEDISENRYHICPAGRGVTGAFSTLIEELTAADRLGTLHTMLPDDIVADAAVLSTGELIVGEREAPFAAVNELLGFVRRIGSLKMCVPAINPRYVSILEDRSSSSRIELLGTGDAFETIENVEPSSFEALSESKAVEMLVIDERPPFAACLSPEDAAVVTYDERMRIHGLVIADDEGSELYGWIERQYESFKRSAEGY